jgi:hypothetical protein
MASTYTDRLGLEKQTDGENPNSWGAILNTNVIDLIDDAIAGYEIVSVSSTGITLTDNQGSTDQCIAILTENNAKLKKEIKNG